MKISTKVILGFFALLVGVIGFILFSHISENVLFKEYIQTFSVFIIVVLVLALCIELFILYFVLRSIQKLKQTAIEVGKGNFDVKANIKTKDELEDLANAMNKMILGLKQSSTKLLESEKEMKKKLEREIKKKTKELDRKLKEAEDARVATMNILEDIDEARKELELEDIRKSELFNITSHELKTPIVPIKGYLELVLSEKYGKINPKQKNALTVVDRNTERLKGLIEDVLDIARLQAGRMKLNIAQVETALVVKEAVLGMKSMAKEKGIALKYNIASLPKLLVDKNRMTQVITNVVKNGIKFTPKGSVIVNARKLGNDIVIDVVDTGIGIAPDDQERVFERFIQVDSSITRKYGGTGLGLPISRGIIENFDGTLTVKSKFGKGSTFTIKLPIKSKLKKGPSYGLAKPLKVTVPVKMVIPEERVEEEKKPKIVKKKKPEKVEEEIDKFFR